LWEDVKFFHISKHSVCISFQDMCFVVRFDSNDTVIMMYIFLITP